MKKEQAEKMDLSAVVANLGESGTLTHRPKAGEPVEITSYDMQRIDDQINQRTGEIISKGRDWARAVFDDGGVLSCRSILLSPEINWGNLTSTKDKLTAVATKKLTFLYVETKVSKRTGNEYKVAHFTPITVG